MKTVFLIFIIFSFSNSLMAAEDCTCPKVTCGPCQKEVTVGKIVKFCDWGDINVCRKVVCENVNFYFGCLSNRKKNRTEKKAEEPTGELELVYEDGQEEKKSDKKPKRGIASEVSAKRPDQIKLETEGRLEADNSSRVLPGVTWSEMVVGKINKTSEKINVFHRGQTGVSKVSQKLYVGDELYNKGEKPQKLSLGFDKGDVDFIISPKSKIIVQDPHSILGRFQPFLYLVHGGVEVHANMSEGSMDLLAGQILTRCRKGKNKVSYVMDEEGLKVKVESIQGDLDVLKAQDLSGKTIQVKEGHFVSWVSETPGHLFTQDEKLALADEGFITPVFVMSENQKRQLGVIVEKKPEPTKLELALRNVEGRSPASLDSDLCQAPAGQFQQCAWSCEGNPKGAKGCQAEQDQVHCVRRTCNAAGQWSPATAFASSYKDLCPAEGIRVGDCSP